METQTKLRKKSFTIVEQAVDQVRGFRNLYQELDDKVRLSGQSPSTLNNYATKLAQLSLHFGKLPQDISGKELNTYLAQLARQSKAPSVSDFKFAIYRLRFCYRLLGMTDKIVQLPSIKRDNKLPADYLFNGNAPATPLSVRGMQWALREAVKKCKLQKRNQ